MTPEEREHPDVIKARLRKKLVLREDYLRYGYLCSGLASFPPDNKYERKDQHGLFNALATYNVFKLVVSGPMSEEHIRGLVWSLYLVPDEVLHLVTWQLLDEHHEIRDGNRPKLRQPITLAYLADKCIAALNATKELDTVCESESTTRTS
jgi:hypothetical protein